MNGRQGWCVECARPYEFEDIVPGTDLCQWHYERRVTAEPVPPDPALAAAVDELPPVVPDAPTRPPRPSGPVREGFVERRAAEDRRASGWRWGAKRSQRRKNPPRYQGTKEQRMIGQRRARNRRKDDRDDT